MAFFDGQNLFHAAKGMFGHRYPNYDPIALANRICRDQGWQCDQVRFYTGVPKLSDNPNWHHFWNSKLATMGGQGAVVFNRQLRYRNETITLPDGTQYSPRVGSEKGIDVRIALDVISLAHRRSYDVGVIFSQDQDLSEAADEIRVIAKEQSRYIKLASAFPISESLKTAKKRYQPRGINNTDWIPFDQATYDACLDPKDHRPASKPTISPSPGS